LEQLERRHLAGKERSEQIFGIKVTEKYRIYVACATFAGKMPALQSTNLISDAANKPPTKLSRL
jgi:hypothetical protein